MAKFNDIRELAQQNARWVSNSPKDWMNYLDVAARLYRYSFKDTLLIHAQRPDATACAELEVWNKKMNRWVNRGAKGIALLDDASPRAKLRYVFDIADTHLVQGGRTPILWRIDDSEHQQMILDHLADTLYSKDFTVMDGGIVETDEYRPVQEVMEEVLAEHGHSVSECGVISAEYLQEQSYRAETQRAEAMKEKLAAEKPAPEASISFYVAECAEFPVMGEFHDNLTLEQALEVYDKIPAERMNGIKSIGFSLEDGSIYSGMFDLMVGGEVQAEIVNHIQHYRESPLVQKAISDMKTLLEKRQASKELEERPSTRQSVREALKNRKKAQEQQSNQEQEKPKKAKKKGEMEL